MIASQCYPAIQSPEYRVVYLANERVALSHRWKGLAKILQDNTARVSRLDDRCISGVLNTINRSGLHEIRTHADSVAQKASSYSFPLGHSTTHVTFFIAGSWSLEASTVPDVACECCIRQLETSLDVGVSTATVSSKQDEAAGYEEQL